MSVLEKITNKLDKVNSAAASEREDICFPPYIQEDDEDIFPYFAEDIIREKASPQRSPNYYFHDYSLVQDAAKLTYEALVELTIADYTHFYAIERVPVCLGVHITGAGYQEDENGLYCFRDGLKKDGTRTRYSYSDNSVRSCAYTLHEFIEDLRIEGDMENPHIKKAAELLQMAYFDKLCNYCHYLNKNRYLQQRKDRNVHLHINNTEGNIMLFDECFEPDQKRWIESELSDKDYIHSLTGSRSMVSLKNLAAEGYFIRMGKRFVLCPEGHCMTEQQSSSKGSIKFRYPGDRCKECRQKDCAGKGENESLYFGKDTYMKDIFGKMLPDVPSPSPDTV